MSAFQRAELPVEAQPFLQRYEAAHSDLMGALAEFSLGSAGRSPVRRDALKARVAVEGDLLTAATGYKPIAVSGTKIVYQVASESERAAASAAAGKLVG